MKFDQEFEKEVVQAVQAFAKAVKANSNVDSNMGVLSEVTSRLKLAQLDYWERLIRDEFSSAIEIKTGYKWWPSLKPDRFLTWIDIFSWDGYSREKALRSLSGPVPNSFFFALSLRRLNDWVPEVRAAARERLPVIIEQSYPTDIVGALSATLGNWESWGRMKESDKEALFQILINEHTFDAFIQHILTCPSGPMTSVLSQLGRSATTDRYLTEISKNAIQPSVRAKAYRSQLERKMKWLEGRQWKWIDKSYGVRRLVPKISERKLSETPDFKSTLHAASEDNSSMVRRVAAELLIQNIETLGVDSSLSYARKFSTDSSSSVSERGIFALRQLGADGESS